MGKTSSLTLKSRISRSTKRLISDQSGGAMIEFTLSFLPFFIVFSGVFGLLRLAYYYSTVEYLANEAAFIATQGGNANGIGSSPVNSCSTTCLTNPSTCLAGAGNLTTRHCRVYDRLSSFQGTDEEIRIDVSVGGVCTKPDGTLTDNLLLNRFGQPHDGNANLGDPRQLISVCVSYDIGSLLPFNLMPIDVQVSGFALGRNEPTV